MEQPKENFCERNNNVLTKSPNGSEDSGDVEKQTELNGKNRPQWSHKTQFLMSCIQTSVGLGNIWRFPFTAYENGGGAFLIPYIILLIVIGKPLYYLEMFMGQFTSTSSIRIWEICPGFRGVGVGQVIASISVITYYCSLISLTMYYFFASFASVLPWSQCLEAWGDNCVDSLHKIPNAIDLNVSEAKNFTIDTAKASSSELYFLNTVLNQTLDISHGIGYPSLPLTAYLFAAWIIVFLIIVKGVKSSGRAAYFLAMFPYVIILALLIRAVTLDGALKGILYFLTPQWDQLLNPKMWFTASVQVFFSLSLGSGTIVMFSSYNHFRHNIYRDALIVTSLDTFTSLIAGITMFGILGNLAKNLGTEDIESVVKSGTGLAFISYPDAITKFEYFPQAFAILFFFMLFVLGIGSVVALQNVVVTVICDQFVSLKYWKVAAVTSVIGFFSGLIYVTPGGQWMLALVDNFGGTFLIFTVGIFEIIGIFWVYGMEDFCLDIEFMTGRKVTFYWRFCWVFLTPVTMIVVFIYSTATLGPLTYAGLNYPDEYMLAGWCIFFVGLIQFPLWAIWACSHNCNRSVWNAISDTFKPSKRWGPNLEHNRIEWLIFKEEAKERQQLAIQTANHGVLKRKLYLLFGKY